MSDHKEDVSKEEACDGTADTSDVADEKVKTSPIDGKYFAESEPSKGKRKKKGEPDTETDPRRSARSKKKPPWQESGDYCMAVQSILTSGVCSDNDPVITCAVKGISQAL